MKIIKKFFLIFILLVINHSTKAMQNENIIKNLAKELIEKFETQGIDLLSLIKNKEELKKILIGKLKELLKSNIDNEELLDSITGKLINHLEQIFINNDKTKDNFIKDLGKFIIKKTEEKKYAIIFGIASSLLFLIMADKLANYVSPGYTIIFTILACLYIQNQISKELNQTDNLYKEIEDATAQILLDTIKPYINK